MQPVLFEPILPFVCLAAALFGPLLALVLHRAAPRTARQWAPSEIVAQILAGLAALVACLMSGLLLEHAANVSVMRTGHGAGIGEPLTWLGMVASGARLSARLAWQLVMLAGPTAWALHRIAARPVGPRILRFALAAYAAPLIVWCAIGLSPPTHASAALLVTVAVVFVVALIAAWPQTGGAGVEPAPSPSLVSQPIEVRADPTPIEVPEPVTRVTRVPAALAASLKTLQARTDQALTRPVPRPTRAPALSEAAVRRARRSRRTL